MKYFGNSFNNIILLFLLFAAAELFIYPVGEFCLNDDWSYTHSVEVYLRTGVVDLGYWPAMTLYSHILWGKLICQVFGFSFLSLRLSKLLLAFSAAALFYQMIVNLSGNKKRAFIFSIFLLFNPLSFSLSNTFMTDVPFMFSIILTAFSIERFWETKKRSWLVVLCLSCIYSVMLRQYAIGIGVALVMAWLIASVFQNNRKNFLILLPMLVLLATYWLFDKWRVNNSTQPSNYVAGTSIINKEVIEILFLNMTGRYSQIVLFVGLFFFPLLIPVCSGFFKTLHLKSYIFVVPVFGCLTWFTHKWLSSFPIGNVLYDCGLGPPLLFDTTILNKNHEHSASALFRNIIGIFGFSGAIMINFCIPAGLVQLFDKLRKKRLVNFTGLYLFCFSIIYLCMLSYTDSFFDRYILPVMFAAGIFISKAGFGNKLVRGVVVIYMSITMLFSVLATKDYFTWNQTRYDLIAEIEKTGVEPININGGLEYIAYRFYSKPWWGFWADSQGTHFITCGKIKDYSKENFKTYRRFLPFKTDTLYVYKKPL